MEIREVQIDGWGGAIHKYMKRKDDGKWVVSGGSWVVRRWEPAEADTHRAAGDDGEWVVSGG